MLLVFGQDLALGSAVVNLTCVGCDSRGERHPGPTTQVLHSGPQWRKSRWRGWQSGVPLRASALPILTLSTLKRGLFIIA